MASKTVRCGVCVGLAVACLGAARGARAQEAESFAASMQRPRNALQLSLQGSLLNYQRVTTKVDTQVNGEDAPEQKQSTTSYGFLGSGFGAGIGYAWDKVLLGVRSEITTSTTTRPGVEDAPEAETSSTTVRLLPRLEVMFDRGTTRPYLAGTLGILHSAGSSSTPIPRSSTSFDTATSESSLTDFVLGAAFGLHHFLTRSVSLDPELGVYYASGSGTSKTSNSGSSLPTSTSQLDFSDSRVQVVLSLGLSAWIDSAPPPSAPPPGPAATPMPLAAAPAAPAAPASKIVSTDIHLPRYRRLYLQLAKDPARPFMLVRLTESRKEFALRDCNEIAVYENGEPVKGLVRTHGEHYLTGRLPIHAAELLATTNAPLSVCNEQWELGQESRESIAVFLKERRSLLGDDEDEPSAPPPAPAPEPIDPASAPSGAVPSSPGAAPGAPAAAPTTRAPIAPATAAPVPPATPGPATKAPVKPKPN